MKKTIGDNGPAPKNIPLPPPIPPRPSNQMPCSVMEVYLSEPKTCSLGLKEIILEKQKEFDKIVNMFKPQLRNVSTKKHRNLVDIEDVYFAEDGISFIASGYAMGSFEDDFFVKWKDLDLDNLNNV